MDQEKVMYKNEPVILAFKLYLIFSESKIFLKHFVFASVFIKTLNNTTIHKKMKKFLELEGL